MKEVTLSSLTPGEHGTIARVAKVAANVRQRLLEMGLIGCIALHGLNGIRVVLFDLGLGLKRQKEIFIGMAIVAAILTGIAFIIALPHIVG